MRMIIGREGNVVPKIQNCLPFVILFLSCMLMGCAAERNTSLPLRTYMFAESEDVIKPSVTLEDQNKFSFTFSALSSYIASGTYEMNGDHLLLKTDDGRYQYLFVIQDKAIVYDAKNSSSLPWYVDIPDGAIFK